MTMQGVDQYKVSVIVPFYNAGAYLSQALKSIAASSHRNIEVILVNDASTDGGGAIAREFVAGDARFRCFENQTNSRVSCCRNIGIEKSTGDFILFVDSDDRISEDWILNLLRAAVVESADVVVGKARRFSGETETRYEMKGLDRAGELKFETLVFKDNAVIWNKLYSAALVRWGQMRFAGDIWIGEDLVFNYMVLGRASRIYYNDVGCYYYRTDSSASIMRSSTPAARIQNLSRVLDLLVECSRTSDRRNREVLRKVAKDILVNGYRHGETIDDSTLRMIRQIDPFMPASVWLNVFVKSLRKAVLPRYRHQ